MISIQLQDGTDVSGYDRCEGTLGMGIWGLGLSFFDSTHVGSPFGHPQSCIWSRMGLGYDRIFIFPLTLFLMALQLLFFSRYCVWWA